MKNGKYVHVKITYPQHRDTHGNVVKTVLNKTHRRFCWYCGKKYFGRSKQGICDDCEKKLKRIRDLNANSETD